MHENPVLDQEGSSGSAASAAGLASRRLGRPSPPSECDIRLTLPARAENIALVRNVVGALAKALRLPEPLVEDVKLAVTEACTNVVRHAYTGAVGPIDVRVEPDAGCLTIVVADRGQGLRSDASTRGAGYGLSLMATLATDMQIEDSPEHGSRVLLSFRR